MSHMDTIRPSSKEAISLAAAELWSQNPGASVSEVAQRAGVGRATLHRHFPARADLLRAVAIQALDETDAACAHLGSLPTARQALAGMFEAMIPLGVPFGFLARCPVDDPEVERRYQEQVHSLEELIEGLRGEGLVAADVPTVWAVEVVNELIWMGWSLVSRGELTPRAAAQLSVRTALRGLAGDDA